MGVNGLWTVLQPCARPTNLATLNRKRLAVDASIWIYQFLKAVRDKEGNALRNSHVVGFFRRICKLLWFGILPVFVFDGGAPALKRATIQGRKKRREGRREDAVRTAGKLLAVQMHRVAVEERERHRREQERDVSAREEQEEEEIPDAEKLVYVDEIGMSQKERQQTRRFHKQDAYHLPELDGGIAAMGKPDDPRIMSVEELEEYARQFHNGEDVNLYDFSNIDFNGDFFKSLPPPDRYNILNAARLRSRLRMGLSKEQLDGMFPDRMAFSRFQIERVQERNHLTQRLMAEVGMTGIDLTLGVNGRVAGEKDREYILVKNEGVEGGWALGVVSKEKDLGEQHKPIDVDAIDIQYQTKDENMESEDDDFEDIPIEGLNRLPKPTQTQSGTGYQAAQASAARRQQLYNSRVGRDVANEGEEGSLFVGGTANPEDLLEELVHEVPHDEDEEDDINKAIALSLQSQHATDPDPETDELFEDAPMAEPEWTQKEAEKARPITGTSGSMIAHIVNNRANAAVPKRQERKQAADSDSDEDMQAVLARSRRTRPRQPAPIVENKKNPFDGPLPFPKLDFGSSLFGKAKGAAAKKTMQSGEPRTEAEGDEDDLEGGFERDQGDDAPKPLPPWLADGTDIRESLKKQHDVEKEINAADREEAQQEERLRRREMRDRLIEIDSSSDDGSDVEVVDRPLPKETLAGDGVIAEEVVSVQGDPGARTSPKVDQELPSSSVTAEEPRSLPLMSKEPEMRTVAEVAEIAEDKEAETRGAAGDVEAKNTESAGPDDAVVDAEANGNDSVGAQEAAEDVDAKETETMGVIGATENRRVESAEDDTPEPDFEDVPPAELHNTDPVDSMGQDTAADDFEDVVPPPVPEGQNAGAGDDLDDELFEDAEYDEFSDSGDEELMVQMAEEAEEHARFASELNNKTAEQNREDYEKELRGLRSQQKKDRRDADEVTQVMITECQALLRLFGIPYVTAPMEAEAQCAELVRLGLVDGIVTDDSDTFLFGGTRVYKNMFNSNKFVECYIGDDLDKELSLSREQLISIAHLLGSDYTEGLPGVGPVTAVEILSEFPGRHGLEAFRDWWREVQSHTRPKEADAPSPFRKKFRKSQATKLFLPPGFPNSAVHDAYLHPEVDDSAEPFQWGIPDVEGLRQFLMATIGWGKERTDEVLVPVIKDMNKRDREGTQSNITRFFGGGVGVGAKEAFAPRARGQGSKRMAAAVDRLRAKTSGGGGGGGGATAAQEEQVNTASSSKRRRTARGRADAGDVADE